MQRCLCDPGYEGHDCSLQAPCECNGRGFCGHGRCFCDPGYGGDDCSGELSCPISGGRTCGGRGLCVLGSCVCVAGVGGIDSWGSLPLPQHRADAQCGGKCEWSFVLRPLSRGDGTIEEMAAEAKDRPNFEPLQLDES